MSFTICVFVFFGKHTIMGIILTGNLQKLFSQSLNVANVIFDTLP